MYHKVFTVVRKYVYPSYYDSRRIASARSANNNLLPGIDVDAVSFAVFFFPI